MTENSGPKIDPKQAVDLAAVGRAADEREAQRAADEERERAVEAARWFKAMKRAFKGTGNIKHADRVRNLRRAAERAQRENRELGE
jgi:hypothetical protein